MKYLTITSRTDAYFTLPEEERNRLGAASIKWIADYKAKKGDKFRFFGSAGDSRNYSLTEFDTYEEYAQSLRSPAFVRGFLKVESIPLIEMDDKMLQPYLDQMKAAK
jgi:hypothetical protein